MVYIIENWKSLGYWSFLILFTFGTMATAVTIYFVWKILVAYAILILSSKIAVQCMFRFLVCFHLVSVVWNAIFCSLYHYLNFYLRWGFVNIFNGLWISI